MVAKCRDCADCRRDPGTLTGRPYCRLLLDRYKANGTVGRRAMPYIDPDGPACADATPKGEK